MKSILDNLVNIRQKKGLSQEFVAQKMGFGQSSLAMIESGKRGLSYNQLSQLAIIYEMDVIDIITYPKKFVDPDNLSINSDVKAFLQLELSSDKKNQVFKIVFGDNNLEILNK